MAKSSVPLFPKTGTAGFELLEYGINRIAPDLMVSRIIEALGTPMISLDSPAAVAAPLSITGVRASTSGASLSTDFAFASASAWSSPAAAENAAWMSWSEVVAGLPDELAKKGTCNARSRQSGAQHLPMSNCEGSFSLPQVASLPAAEN